MCFNRFGCPHPFSLSWALTSILLMRWWANQRLVHERSVHLILILALACYCNGFVKDVCGLVMLVYNCMGLQRTQWSMGLLLAHGHAHSQAVVMLQDSVGLARWLREVCKFDFRISYDAWLDSVYVCAWSYQALQPVQVQRRRPLMTSVDQVHIHPRC